MTDRRRGLLTLGAAALVAYVPLLLSSPGRVGADTKTYLYLDPGRLLRDASTLWDSDVALGTVTHQNIGYLWPMGPFYWVFEAIGSPDWVAQRMWLGTLLFAAGAGVWFLLRTLEWRGGGLLVAMLAYELSPYLLDYSARISAVLLPWAGLPWMIAFTIRASRSGGWRHPALFALTILTVGSVNATSLLLVGLAPVLWLVHATFVERSLALDRMIRAVLRIGTLTIGVSLWWMSGLLAQGAYSLPVTRYTETYEVVADASTAPEILRGLGYWFFYGNDKFGQWIDPSIDYTQGIGLLFLSFGLVVFALASAALVRWRHRSYFLLLLVVGALIGIGSHPFDSPSALGRLFKEFTRTDAGLALRSTPRALPMLVLATAVLLGAGVNAAQRRWPGGARPLALVALAAVVLNNPAMWKARMIEPELDRDEDLPDYWVDATERLDELDDGTRVFEVPGTDFASYRWGNTVDPITPGLIDRGYVARELVPFGSAESAALVTAFDRRLQEDSLDVDSVLPVARLMSVGDIVHRADLTYERFRTPRPVPTADLLDRVPGLVLAEGFGEAVPNVAGPQQTMLDEVFLGIDPTLPDPAPVTRYEVDAPLPIVRLRSVEAPIVVVGDADGLVDAAGADLVDTDRTLVFAADLLTDDEVLRRSLAEPASIIVTDSNRKRARRWGTLRENVGYTEREGEEPLRHDPTDNRLPTFPDLEAVAGLVVDDTRTVSVQTGPYSVQATAYGNPVTYTNDDRAFLAVDGSIDTAWSVAAFGEPRGEILRFEYDEPTTVDTITVVQPQPDTANRHITEVRIRADGRSVSTVALEGSSRQPAGQQIELGEPTSATVWELEITDVDFPRQPTYPGVSPVGFAEVRLGGAERVEEAIRTPRALVDRIGDDLDRHDLSVVLTRERSNPAEPVREDPEQAMRRLIPLPTDREFTVEGTVRLAAGAPEPTIDGLVGRQAAVDGGTLRAHSSGPLPGDLGSIASSAFDGSPSTAWTGRFGGQAGQSITIQRDVPVPIEGITLSVVTDAVHSVPAVVRVLADGREVAIHETGAGLVDAPRGTTLDLMIPVATSAASLTIEAVAVHERLTRDWYSNALVAMPMSVAEVDAGEGFRFAPTAPSVDPGCRPDLLTVDGTQVAARVAGSTIDALARRELSLVGCESVSVGAGDVSVVTTPGSRTGIDVDQLVLTSPRPVTTAALPQPAVTESSDTYYRVEVDASEQDRWLVLGQSHNDGWRLTSGSVDLGDAAVVDGFGNGWIIPAGAAGVFELRWTPQRVVDWTIRVSLVFVLFAVVLAWRGRPDRPHPSGTRVDGPPQPTVGPVPLLEPDRSRAPDPRTVLAVAVAVTVAVALNLPQSLWLAVGLGLLFHAAVRVPRIGAIAPLLAAGSLGLAALAVLYEQRRFRRPPDFVWPQQFEEVHILGVLAVLLVLVEYVRSSLAPEGPQDR